MEEAHLMERIITAKVYYSMHEIDTTKVRADRLERVITCANWWAKCILNTGCYDLVPDPVKMPEDAPQSMDLPESMLEDLVENSDPVYMLFRVTHRAPRYDMITVYENKIRWMDFDFERLQVARGKEFVLQHRLANMVVRPNTRITWSDHRMYEDQQGYEHEFPIHLFPVEAIQVEMIIFEAYRKCGYPEELMMHSFHDPANPSVWFSPKHMFRWFGPSLKQIPLFIYVLCLLTEDLFCFETDTKIIRMMHPKSKNAKRTLSTFFKCTASME